MPKLIDYPRTSYTGAWEVAEVVDDTGGKCALETCARKLNRKVSGSFKAIVGSGVKFGLLTSKREMLTTTTLFRRIKHAYDKQEELLFHREAFLTPPLFTQLCRKFRSRELPVAMLDVLLIREFGVEEINVQGVAKAFTDGARMVGILDENNVVADIDQLAAKQPPRRELANPPLPGNVFRQTPAQAGPATDETGEDVDDTDEVTESESVDSLVLRPTNAHHGRATLTRVPLPPTKTAPLATTDAIAHLFGFDSGNTAPVPRPELVDSQSQPLTATPASTVAVQTVTDNQPFRIQLIGPGLNTQLDVVDVEDLALVRALLDKMERRLKQ